MLKVIAWILLGEILTLAGMILYKKSLNLIKPGKYLIFIKNALSLPKVWIGFFLIGIGTIAWLVALAQTELNIAYSLDSMQYILILAGSRIFLGERIDRDKLAGTLLVVVGIILVVVG